MSLGTINDNNKPIYIYKLIVDNLTCDNLLVDNYIIDGIDIDTDLTVGDGTASIISCGDFGQIADNTCTLYGALTASNDIRVSGGNFTVDGTGDPVKAVTLGAGNFTLDTGSFQGSDINVTDPNPWTLLAGNTIQTLQMRDPSIFTFDGDMNAVATSCDAQDTSTPTANPQTMVLYYPLTWRLCGIFEHQWPAGNTDPYYVYGNYNASAPSNMSPVKHYFLVVKQYSQPTGAGNYLEVALVSAAGNPVVLTILNNNYQFMTANNNGNANSSITTSGWPLWRFARTNPNIGTAFVEIDLDNAAWTSNGPNTAGIVNFRATCTSYQSNSTGDNITGSTTGFYTNNNVAYTINALAFRPVNNNHNNWYVKIALYSYG